MVTPPVIAPCDQLTRRLPCPTAQRRLRVRKQWRATEPGSVSLRGGFCCPTPVCPLLQCYVVQGLVDDAATLIEHHRQGQRLETPNGRHGIDTGRWKVVNMIAVHKDSHKSLHSFIVLNLVA